MFHFLTHPTQLDHLRDNNLLPAETEPYRNNPKLTKCKFTDKDKFDKAVKMLGCWALNCSHKPSEPYVPLRTRISMFDKKKKLQKKKITLEIRR